MTMPTTKAEIKADFVIYLNGIQVNEDFFIQTMADLNEDFKAFIDRIIAEYIDECEEHFPGEINTHLYKCLEESEFKAFCIAYLKAYHELFTRS